VEHERGQEADDTTGDRQGGESQAVMLGDLGFGRTIPSAADPLESALGHEASQKLGVNADPGHVRGPDDSALPGEGQ